MILFTGQLFIKVKYNNIKTKILIKAPALLRRLYAREKKCKQSKKSGDPRPCNTMDVLNNNIGMLGHTWTIMSKTKYF